ncbi:MAG: hybrid sensor histidine kinase/response regulator, partial [Mangrovicoccus sp.]
IVHTDVTDMMRLERRERERMLDDQARIIRATLDHINQGVCIFDRDKLLVGWNRRVSSLLALPAGRLVFGTSFDRLFALMEDRVKFSDPVAADRMRDWVNHTGPRPALTFEIQRGSNVILDVFAAETPDRGFVVSFTDVTAEREAVRAMVDANESLEQRVMDRTLALEDALADAERANASKSRFVAAASHDLLQPLSAAKLFLSSLESGGASPSDVADTVKRATNALGSVETILGSLLDISKLDAGLAAMEPGPVPLGLVMRTLAEEFTPLAAKKGLRLRIIPCNVTVTSDAAYLRRILQNLIANAIRYTDQGRVIIGARRLKGQVRVEIWDTGAGIPPDEQQKIFGEFHRVGATSSAGEGMGLGLAIVDRACTLLGHNLSLWSELGRGSGFFVTFDLADCAGSSLPKPRIDGPRLTAEALENVLVLLIENDHELRIAMCRQLEAWGLSVLDVPGIQSAQELLEEVDITPDLVICDYQLDDGTTGLDALDQLTPKIGKVPAIMVTANRSQDLRAEVKRRGLDLLHKPLDPAQLHARICELMTEPVRLTG